VGTGSVIPGNGAAFTLDEVVAATRGTLLPGPPNGARGVVGVFTDTRVPVPAGLFVALAGDQHDAHDFLSVAVERGAAALLIGKRRPAPVSVPAVEVDDTLVALGDLAAFHRRRSTARVIAITGSVGKTSVKNMVAAICATAGATLATDGNLNNLVGAPLTLLRISPAHQFVVLEIGTSRPGEIARLAAIANPEVGLVTRIGASHLEGLGSLDGVQVEKGALFTQVAATGVGVVNLADPRVAAEAATLSRRITFGAPGADVALATRRSIAGGPPRIAVDTPAGLVEAQLALLGEHQVDNAVAAVAVGIALGIAPADIARGLESVVPAPGRMVAIPMDAGGLVLDDTYNANPESMAAARDTLASVAEGRRRVAVLGDMLELGDHAQAAHEDVGRAAARAGLAVLVACGPSAQAVADGAIAGGLEPGAIEVTPDSRAGADRVRARVQSGDIVLVKGSRGMRMEMVVAALVPAAAAEQRA
jgi:UDP-N-acetylmuramoyl-tripeptide--D-alanyl-D-alanine ligase